MIELHTKRSRGPSRPRVATAVILAMLAASCGNSRDATRGDETVPRIPPTTVAPTSAPSTVAPTSSTTTTVAPVTSPAVIPPPATSPWPTSATVPPTPPPTEPPATQRPTTEPAATQPPQTQPPATQPPATEPPAAQAAVAPPPAVTQPPVTPAPTTVPAVTPPPTSAPGPTSTVVVTPSERPPCDAVAIGTDTGLLTISGVRCSAGWAIAEDVTCSAGQACEGVDVFHITGSGWVHDGYFPATCAEGLTGAGMSIHTAASFVPEYCQGEPAPPAIIRPDSSGDPVVQLQTALIGQGYAIAADGTYGPRTQAAVRDFQSRHGLEVDGIAGPRTQAALGIGPGAQSIAGATATTVAVATTTTATTIPVVTSPVVTSTTTVTTTTVVGAGEPAACTPAAIAEDIGRTVDAVTACHSGWALGYIQSCNPNAACPKIDVFHVTDAGWVHDGSVSQGCAEDLQDAGMSAYTAGEFVGWCGVPNLPSDRLVIEPGSTGIAVEHLQIALVALGYPIAVDGTYGPGTEQAVRSFQESNGLEVDGIAGPRTRELLGV